MLSTLLRARLRQMHRLAIVGIGSDLRGDDAAGLLVLHHLRAALVGHRTNTIRLFNGGTAPENMTGAITRFMPSHILLVDAADLGQKPGTLQLIAPENISGVSFSTHVLPLNILTAYLQRALPCQAIIIGIQPGLTGFSLTHSHAIDQAARRLARIILQTVPLRGGYKKV